MKLCCISDFEEGFLRVAEVLDHIVADTPKAVQVMATMMGAGLDRDEEHRSRIVQNSTDSDKLLKLLPQVSFPSRVVFFYLFHVASPLSVSNRTT